MEFTLNQQAINLAALFFVRGGYSMESGLHDGEVQALHVLKEAKAVVPGQINARDAMCAFCGLYRGPIFRNDDGLMVQCPDCGPFRLDPASQRSWQLDDEWLIRRLRGGHCAAFGCIADCRRRMEHWPIQEAAGGAGSQD